MSFWVYVIITLLVTAGFYLGILVPWVYQVIVGVVLIIIAIRDDGRDWGIAFFLIGSFFVYLGIGAGDVWYYFFMYDAPVEQIKEAVSVTKTVAVEKSFSIIDWLNSKPFEGK